MAYQLTFFGRVQGVGFRYFVLRKAELLGVKGFVKNLPDGSVYCEAEANHETIEQFIEICKKGPERSVITDFSIIEIPDTGYTQFRIR